MKSLRFYLMPLDICGYYSGLANGLVATGHRCELLHLGNDTSGHWDRRRNSAFTRFYDWMYRRAYGPEAVARSRIARFADALALRLALLLLIARIATRFDVIVMKSGEGFSGRQWDKGLFRLIGLKIVYIYHGSDSRPPYMNAYFNRLPLPQVLEWTQRQKRQVQTVTPYADLIVDNPLSAHFQTTDRVCVYQCIGNMMEPEKIAAAPNSRSETIRIVHAPSSIEVKGTDRIRAAMARLKEDGFAIDYVELSGRPNMEVMREIAASDIVVDELYSDMHGALLAIEALSMGKPAVVCGYGASELARLVPPDAAPPTMFSHPDELYDTLRRLVVDPELRRQAGEAGRAFYRRHSEPSSVARRLVLAVQGQAPDNWFFDPRDIRYYGGVAGEETRIADTALRLVQAYSEQALELDDKPALRDAMLAEFRALLANRHSQAAS